MNYVKFNVVPSPQAEALFARLKDHLGKGMAIAKAMDTENFATVAAIKRKIGASPTKGLRGDQTLHRRTGRLQSSIGQTKSVVEASETGLAIRSSIGSGVGSGGEAVRYAAIHEFGGRIQMPARSRMQHFAHGKFASVSQWNKARRRYWGETSRKVTYSRPYTVVMPSRSYIRSTFNERSERYPRRIKSDLMAFVKGGGR